MGVHTINWFLIGIGIVLGLVVVAGLSLWLGRRFLNRLNLHDRGEWDKPLPEPFPRNLVVAMYKRRKRYHQHHRDHFRHGQPDDKVTH